METPRWTGMFCVLPQMLSQEWLCHIGIQHRGHRDKSTLRKGRSGQAGHREEEVPLTEDGGLDRLGKEQGCGVLLRKFGYGRA